MASAWGASWGSAWGNAWGILATVTVDTHDGADHTREERKRVERFKAEKDALKQQITHAFEVVTGEVREPTPEELPRLEKQAGSLPKAQRADYRRTFMQIRNWQAEVARIDRIIAGIEFERILAQDEEDIIVLAGFL